MSRDLVKRAARIAARRQAALDARNEEGMRSHKELRALVGTTIGSWKILAYYPTSGSLAVICTCGRSPMLVVESQYLKRQLARFNDGGVCLTCYLDRQREIDAVKAAQGQSLRDARRHVRPPRPLDAMPKPLRPPAPRDT